MSEVIEALPESYIEAYDSKTSTLAEEAGQAAGDNFRLALDEFVVDRVDVDAPPITVPLSVEQADEMAAKKARDAELRFINDRERGLNNDTESTGTGFAALVVVTTQDRPRFEDFKASVSGHPGDGIEIESIGFDASSGEEYVVAHFPKGKYRTNSDEDTMFMEFNELAGGRLALSTENILTVLGSEGEIWQHPEHLDLPELVDAAPA